MCAPRPVGGGSRIDKGEINNQRLGLKTSYDGLRSRYKKLPGNSLAWMQDGDRDEFDKIYDQGNNAPSVKAADFIVGGKRFSGADGPSYDFRKSNLDAMNSAYDDLNNRYKTLRQQQFAAPTPVAPAPPVAQASQPEPLQPPRQPGLNAEPLNGALQTIGNQWMANRNAPDQAINNRQGYQGFITK